MPLRHLTPLSLHGVSFSVPDLLLLRGWAEAQALRMTVHLDHAVEMEEYEEVLAFSRAEGSACQWLIWRSMQCVFVQPLLGRRQAYRDVAAAMESLAPNQRFDVTDIVAITWPGA